VSRQSRLDFLDQHIGRGETASDQSGSFTQVKKHGRQGLDGPVLAPAELCPGRLDDGSAVQLVLEVSGRQVEAGTDKAVEGFGCTDVLAIDIKGLLQIVEDLPGFFAQLATGDLDGTAGEFAVVDKVGIGRQFEGKRLPGCFCNLLPEPYELLTMGVAEWLA